MEVWSVAHRDLQMFCARNWPGAQDCQLILDEIGVSSIRINLSEPSIMRWLSILRELMLLDNGSMAKLVVVLMRQYPENQDLRKVCAPWIPIGHIQGGDDITESPKPTMSAQAVLDYEEEETLFRARVESLWLEMGGLEKRLAVIEKWRKNGDTV